MPNKLTKKNFSTLITIKADDHGKLPSEIQVLPVGKWNTEFYGALEVKTSHVAEIVKNFDKGIRKAVPIDVDHDGGKAAGWVKELINKGKEGVYAVVEWTKYGQELLDDKIYKLFSPEWSFNYVDPAHGTKHGAVLIAGSLTNRPLFKELPMLVASDSINGKSKDLTTDNNIVIILGTDMNLAKILAKDPKELTDEEKKLIVASASELSSDAKKKFADILKADDNKDDSSSDDDSSDDDGGSDEDSDDDSDDSDSDDEDGDDKDDEDSDDKKGNVSVSKSQMKRYKAMEVEHKKLKRVQLRTATEKEVSEKFMAKDKVRITPAVKKEVVKLVLASTEAQKESLYKILGALPKLNIEGEAGSSDKDSLTAEEKINKLVEEATKADDKLTVSDAYKKVLSENTELANQYETELRSN